MQIIKPILCTLALILALSASAEFTGTITYKLTCIPTNTAIKEKTLVELCGKKNLFYYKNGAHKWYNPKGGFEYELYNPAVDPDHIYSKYRNSDTIFKQSVLTDKDTFADFREEESQIILGKVCHGATIQMVNDREKVTMIRTWFCPSTGTEIDKDRYAHWITMGTSQLTSHFHRLPYRIVIQFPRQGYALIFEAKTVSTEAPDDSVFQLDSTKPIKFVED